MQDSFPKQEGLGATPTNSANTSSLSTTPPNDTSMKKQKTLEDYELVNQPNKTNPDLGKGSFGQVKLVRDKADPKKLYALKIINKKELMAASSIDYLKREIKIQKKLDHPHIIKLHHYFEDKDNVYLILEYAKNGNLFFYLRRKKTLTEKESFVYFLQTCIGIDYLHKKGILHRDLKPENLLLDATGNIKVCDFGWSAEDIGKRNTFCGTVDYMAPEMIQNQAHNFKIDIWSLGILLYELIHGHPPFQGKTANEKFQSILDKDLKFKDGLSNEIKDLLSGLLRSNPNERPGFDAIFTHPWILKYEKDFGMSVQSFIYDPSKKKDKSGKKTPTDQSPGSIVTPGKETTPTISPNSQATGSASQIKTKPFNPDTSLNVSVQSPIESFASNLKGIEIPQTSQFDPKKSPSPTPQIPSSDANSNLSSRRSPSPLKGPNMAQELVQGISLPSQSPSKRGIFTPTQNLNKSPSNASSQLVNTQVPAGNYEIKTNLTPKEEKTFSFPSGNPPARSPIEDSSSFKETRTQKDKYANLYLDQTSPSGSSQYQTNPAPASNYSTTSPNSNVLRNMASGLPQENKMMTPKEQFNNPAGTALQSNPLISPSSQYTSKTTGYDTGKSYSNNVQSHSETNLRSPHSTSEPYQKHGISAGDVDFFVPKADNIESTLVKLSSGSKVKPQPAYSGADASSFTAHNKIEFDQSEPVRVTRVTNLLQKNSFSDVDQIMEKLLNHGERATNYQSGEKSLTDLTEKKSATPDGRITNIDKYLANYQLEDTEENVLLDKLDNYYTTGNLDTDNGRYPRREQNELKKEIPKSQPENVVSKAPEVARREEVEKSQAMHHRIHSNELSFQDDSFRKNEAFSLKKPLSRDFTAEMSFADMPRESEEFSVKNANLVKDDKKRDVYTHHIQEETEEDESVERKVRGHASEKRANPFQENQRKEDMQTNYGVQNQGRVEKVEKPYNDQRQQATGAKRRDYDYQPEEELYRNERGARYQSDYETVRRDEVSPYGGRGAEGRRREDASGFITRIVEQERREAPNLRMNQKVQSYEPQSSTEYVNKDLHRLENQREDVMKRYRNRLNGLYHFNSEVGISTQEKHYDTYGNRNSDNEGRSDNAYGQYREEKNYYNAFEREQAEKRDRDAQYRRGYNDKHSQSFHQYQTDERYNNPKRRKDDWPEEYDSRKYSEQDYYSNKSFVQNYKSMDATYEEMRRKRQELIQYTEDDLDEETVSRPSWRNQREIPKGYRDYEEKKQPTLIEKISALFGCLDRTEKQPKKARKGRRVC